MLQQLIIYVLFVGMLLFPVSCGFKAPPLPPLPSTPQQSEMDGTAPPVPFPSSTPTTAPTTPR